MANTSNSLIEVEIAGEHALLLRYNMPPSLEVLLALKKVISSVGKQTIIVDSVISYVSLLLVYSEKSNLKNQKEKLIEIALQHLPVKKTSKAQKPTITNKITSPKKTAAQSITSITHKIPVCYEECYGIDIVALAKKKKLSVAEVIALHSKQEYVIYALGFLPGFPFCGFVHSSIAEERKKTPRLAVPAGSVGIAGSQTGIYPTESPGGWNIIGKVAPSFFESKQKKLINKKLLNNPMLINNISLFSIGDKVRFFPINKKEM